MSVSYSYRGCERWGLDAGARYPTETDNRTGSRGVQSQGLGTGDTGLGVSCSGSSARARVSSYQSLVPSAAGSLDLRSAWRESRAPAPCPMPHDPSPYCNTVRLLAQLAAGPRWCASPPLRDSARTIRSCRLYIPRPSRHISEYPLCESSNSSLPHLQLHDCTIVTTTSAHLSGQTRFYA